MTQTFFSPAMLRAMTKQIEASNAPAACFPRATARALCFELLRYYETEGIVENQRTQMIQQLAMEYCAAHICDLLQSVLDQPDMADVPGDATLAFVMGEIRAFVATSQLQALGNA